MTVAPAGGPGRRGFHGLLGLFPNRRNGFAAGQGACGRAVIRSQAVTMAAAQGPEDGEMDRG